MIPFDDGTMTRMVAILSLGYNIANTRDFSIALNGLPEPVTRYVDKVRGILPDRPPYSQSHSAQANLLMENCLKELRAMIGEKP